MTLVVDREVCLFNQKNLWKNIRTIGNLSIYGQESNPTTWKLAKMNLAIRGIDGDLGPNNGGYFP